MPADTTYGALPTITLGGTEISGSASRLVEEVVVHQHLHLPDMVEVRFRDSARTVLGDLGARNGAAIAVASTAVGSRGAQQPIFEGEVTAVEAEFDASSGTHTVLRGYDKGHRLMKKRHTRAFNNSTLADLATQLGGESGMSVDAAAGRVTYEHIAQVNESDWDFLRRLARENGMEVATDGGRLLLRTPPTASAAPREGDLRQEPDPLQVVLGTNLRSLRVRLTAASQVQQVEVRAWDWKRKRELVGTARPDTGSVQLNGHDVRGLAATFAASPAMASDRPWDSAEQVNAAAKSLAELIAASSAEAYGTMDGNPALKAGKAISISGVGDRFNGKYLVTAARHVFDEEGFRTQFEITGRQDRSVLGLTGLATADDGDHRINGVVVGIVTNNKDDEGHGRVKLKFPWLSADLESGWARVASFDAGPDGRGGMFLPEVNDEVLVAFEHGDFRRPYVLGSLWNGQDKAPAIDLVSRGQVNHREYRSRLGHRLHFGDKDDDAHIELVTADGKRSVKLDQTQQKVVVKVGQSTVEITDQGDLTVDAKGNMTIKAVGNLKFEATGNVEIKGATVKVEGQGQTEIKGGVVRIN